MLGFEKELNKLASFCGFKTAGETGGDPASLMKKHLSQTTKDATPLSDLLPFECAESSTGLFFNKDNHVGFWFEVSPLVGSNEDLEKNLTLFFNDELPEDGCLQFLVVASHDISSILRGWEEARLHGGKELKYLTACRKWFIEKCSRDFTKGYEGRLARNYRTFVSYSAPYKGDKDITLTLAFQRKLETKLRTEKLSPKMMLQEGLIVLGRDILEPGFAAKTRETVRYDPLQNLSEQVAGHLGFRNIQEEKIIHSKGIESKCFYVKEQPEEFSLSGMKLLLGTSDKVVPGRFVISYTLKPLGKAGTAELLTQGSRSINAAERSYTRHDISAKEQAREWIGVIDRHKKGERFMLESTLVMLTAPSSDMPAAEEALKSLWNAYDWKLETSRNLQLLGSVAILPMAQSFYLQSIDYFKLAKKALSADVVAKLPIQGEWKGVPVSGVLLMGICGQLFNFNPYYRIGGGGNYNICMMAPSGSGKSFFLEELASSSIAQDVQAFIMDIGASYKNICSNFGGEMIRFNKSNKVSLNPFAGLSSSGAEYIKALELISAGKDNTEIAKLTGILEEKVEALRVGRSEANGEVKETDGIEVLELVGEGKTHFVTKDSIIYAKAMLSSMCGISGDTRCEAILERAITAGIGRFGTELDITRLEQVLYELKDARGNIIEGAAQLADSLYPYTEQGVHGRFFKSGQAANFDKALTVFEFEELVNDAPLLAVVLQVLLMQITMKFLCGDRSKYFLLIVDEAWMIMDFAASFLERFARTVRKYGGSLVVCTQDLTSFKKGPSQSAIFESSTWKLIMQQSEQGIESFAKDTNYQNYLGLIKSVRKCSNNKFSEVLIDTNGVKVIGRLVTDPYSTALYSTESSDFNFLLGKEKEGVSKHEAILELARKKYGELPEELES